MPTRPAHAHRTCKPHPACVLPNCAFAHCTCQGNVDSRQSTGHDLNLQAHVQWVDKNPHSLAMSNNDDAPGVGTLCAGIPQALCTCTPSLPRLKLCIMCEDAMHRQECSSCVAGMLQALPTCTPSLPRAGTLRACRHCSVGVQGLL